MCSKKCRMNDDANETWKIKSSHWNHTHRSHPTHQQHQRHLPAWRIIPRSSTTFRRLSHGFTRNTPHTTRRRIRCIRQHQCLHIGLCHRLTTRYISMYIHYHLWTDILDSSGVERVSWERWEGRVEWECEGSSHGVGKPWNSYICGVAVDFGRVRAVADLKGIDYIRKGEKRKRKNPQQQRVNKLSYNHY